MTLGNRISAWLLGTAVVLSGCGGGGGDAGSAAPTSPAPTAAPGGLYVGYYQEDPATNPEDPVPGAFSLNLPETNGSFSGSMFFTYVGCQTSNVGVVGGTKTDLAVSGTWAGTVDGVAESGTYAGSYDSNALAYSGTYRVDKGKQFFDLRPCTQYYIGPNGSFEMFAIEAHNPATFSVAVSGRTVAWGAVPAAATTLVYVLDPAIATSTGNPVLYQTIVGAGVSATVPSTVTLVSGRPYIAVVAVLDASFRRIAFSSQRFTPP